MRPSLLFVGLVAVVASVLSFPRPSGAQSLWAESYDPAGRPVWSAGSTARGLVPTVRESIMPGLPGPDQAEPGLRWAGVPSWAPPGSLSVEEAYARAAQLRARQGAPAGQLLASDHGCPCKALGGCACGTCVCGQVRAAQAGTTIPAQIAAAPADCEQCCLLARRRQRWQAPQFNLGFNNYTQAATSGPAWAAPQQYSAPPRYYGYPQQWRGSFEGPQFRGQFQVCPNGMCPLGR